MGTRENREKNMRGSRDYRVGNIARENRGNISINSDRRSSDSR